MKKLLILFAFIPALALSQIPGSPDANGVITAGPPFVTGTNTGEGELQLQYTYLNAAIILNNAMIDSSKVVFNYETSVANPDSINTRALVADTSNLDLVIADSLAVAAIRYTDTYWDDIRVPMSNTKLNAAQSEPALEEFIAGVYAYAFEADADSAERLNFVLQLPHKRKAATDLDAHIHWSPSTTNGGDCYWRFSYTIISINGTFAATTHLRVADAGDGTALKHQLVDLGTIDGSTLGISSVLIGNITRLGEAAADTFTGVAYGLEFDLHYEMDAPGSEEELVKY